MLGPGVDIWNNPTWLPPNVLVDGDMEAVGTGAWTAIGSTLSKETTDPYQGAKVLRVTANPAGVPTPCRAVQNVLIVGKEYHLTGVIRSDGAMVPLVFDGVTVLFTGSTSTTWQPIYRTFTAGGTFLQFFFVTTPAGTEYIELDALSCIRTDQT